MNEIKATFTTLRMQVRRTETARRHYEEVTAERDRLIVALLESGNSTRKVAEIAKLTQARIVQIHDHARQASGERRASQDGRAALDGTA